MEGWPRGSDGPVFDICHGDAHVARIWRDRGAWRLVVRSTQQISCELSSFLQVVAMVADRMQSLETVSAAGDLVADGPFCLIDERGRAGAADMDLMAKLLFAGKPPQAESSVRWGDAGPAHAAE